jgi:hypothetical protein
MVGAKWQQDNASHAQGLYYNYKLDGFSNTLMAFSSLNITNLNLDIPRATQKDLHDITIKSIPSIFGFKEKFTIEWWKDHAEARGGAEVNIFRYRATGNTFYVITDVGDYGDIRTIDIDRTIYNLLYVGYLENKFTFAGLTVVPGVHSEYLSRTRTVTVDPRGMISYSFPTKTTIAAAGGYYSKFIQSNLNFFQSTLGPELVSNNDLKPNRSCHRAVSIEQKIDRYTFKAEGFYNNFWDIVTDDIDTAKTQQLFVNSAKVKTRGIEIMIKINDEEDQGLFGWVNYTYNEASYITHQSSLYSDSGNMWHKSPYELRHVGKLVVGYTFGHHTISARYQYNTSMPYTPIVGSNPDPKYTASPRNIPTYGYPYSKRLAPDQRLDIRYSYKTNYSWGHVAWYIELINALNHQPEEYRWDYRYSYSSGNNPEIKKLKGLAVFPNFGVEAKF